MSKCILHKCNANSPAQMIWMYSNARQFRYSINSLFLSGFVKETSWYNCHCVCALETCQSGNFSHVLNEFLQLLFSPDTERCLCCISMRQKITASVLSGSLQVEVLHLACVDGGGDSNADRGSAQHWSPQIMGTIGQMTADKLSRVEWPREGKRE